MTSVDREVDEAVIPEDYDHLDPSFAVGAAVRELGTNAHGGSGEHFVVEADEYDYSFLWLRPTVAIVTTEFELEARLQREARAKA